MSENIKKEVGNYVGTYSESCPRSITGVWKDYMRVRVAIDLSKPLRKENEDQVLDCVQI